MTGQHTARKQKLENPWGALWKEMERPVSRQAGAPCAVFPEKF
jgi:hypothetical protein